MGKEGIFAIVRGEITLQGLGYNYEAHLKVFY